MLGNHFLLSGSVLSDKHELHLRVVEIIVEAESIQINMKSIHSTTPVYVVRYFVQILNWHMRNLIKECNVITLRNQYSNTTLPQLLFLQLLNNLSLFFYTLLGHDCSPKIEQRFC